MLQYIKEAARLRPLERKACKVSRHRRVSFHEHLGDGIYVTVLCHKHIIDFCKHFVMYGESIRSVLSSRSGISIRIEDEWIDLQQNVIPDIHRCLPMHNRNVDVFPMVST